MSKDKLDKESQKLLNNLDAIERAKKADEFGTQLVYNDILDWLGDHENAGTTDSAHALAKHIHQCHGSFMVSYLESDVFQAPLRDVTRRARAIQLRLMFVLGAATSLVVVSLVNLFVS